MATTSNPVHDMVLHNASDFHDYPSSFDAYFETTNEYRLLLNLHRIVPPTLVCIGCVGSAFTLAVFYFSRKSSCITREYVILMFILLVLYRSEVP